MKITKNCHHRKIEKTICEWETDGEPRQFLHLYCPDCHKVKETDELKGNGRITKEYYHNPNLYLTQFGECDI